MKSPITVSCILHIADLRTLVFAVFIFRCFQARRWIFIYYFRFVNRNFAKNVLNCVNTLRMKRITYYNKGRFRRRGVLSWRMDSCALTLSLGDRLSVNECFGLQVMLIGKSLSSVCFISGFYVFSSVFFFRRDVFGEIRLISLSWFYKFKFKYRIIRIIRVILFN